MSPWIRLFTCWVAICCLAPAARATTVTLTSDRDNTLYEDIAGSLSNGAGTGMFAGVNGQGMILRALVHFPIAGNVPGGATINSVTLGLNMSMTQPGNRTISLHRAKAAWGEGTSFAGSGQGGGAAATPGDATWLNTFYPGGLWTNAGGDFVASSSANLSVGAIGPYTWGSTAGMVADVKAWRDSPSQNFGWVLTGDEINSSSAKRFDTHEIGVAVNEPTLTVDYTLNAAAAPVPGALIVRLAPSVPNPFNRSTTVSYELSSPADVELEVFDASGKFVRSVIRESQSAGQHSAVWAGRDSRGAAAPAGVYWVRLRAGGIVRTSRMVLAR